MTYEHSDTSTLRGTDVDVDFTDAVLAQSDLRASLFSRVKFVRTVLRDADMRQSSFESCDFTDALLTGAILTNQQGAIMNLSQEQRKQIEWTDDEGSEPKDGQALHDLIRDLLTGVFTHSH
jgi:hypothetical protein